MNPRNGPNSTKRCKIRKIHTRQLFSFCTRKTRTGSRKQHYQTSCLASSVVLWSRLMVLRHICQVRQRSEDACRVLDSDYQGWALPPAAEALGKLIAYFPDRFGRAVLTTNFDPLLEVAIASAGGHYFRTVLHRDGNLGQTEGTGCHVIHLHGYWYGADTLHTPRQLTQARPRLKASLSSLIRGKIVVVAGYGGWDDVFTDTLMETVLDDSSVSRNHLGTSHRSNPLLPDTLVQRLSAGMDRGRLTLYEGIDCQAFPQKLLDRWIAIEPPITIGSPTRPSDRMATIVGDSKRPGWLGLLLSAADHERQLEGREEDRPPLVEICVGRDLELGQLASSKDKLCFITGFGGQGKSISAGSNTSPMHTV